MSGHQCQDCLFFITRGHFTRGVFGHNFIGLRHIKRAVKFFLSSKIIPSLPRSYLRRDTAAVLFSHSPEKISTRDILWVLVYWGTSYFEDDTITIRSNFLCIKSSEKPHVRARFLGLNILICGIILSGLPLTASFPSNLIY